MATPDSSTCRTRIEPEILDGILLFLVETMFRKILEPEFWGDSRNCVLCCQLAIARTFMVGDLKI